MENDNKLKQNCLFCNLEESTDNVLVVKDEILSCENCLKSQILQQSQFYDNKVLYPEISKITDKIYLGNEDAQRSKDLLKEFGITHILVCAYGIKQFFPNEFIYKSVDLDDSIKQDLTEYIPEAIKFIDSAERIFVHCQAGISRSPAIVIAYLIYREKMTYEQAKAFVKERRRCINPNSGFESQLIKYQKKSAENNSQI